jgi:hypothetical protein
MDKVTKTVREEGEGTITIAERPSSHQKQNGQNTSKVRLNSWQTELNLKGKQNASFLNRILAR